MMKNRKSSFQAMPAAQKIFDTIPWSLPLANDTLRQTFALLGEVREFASGDVVLSAREKMDRLYLIERGAFSQAVVNYRLNKPLAMTIYFSGSINGILNLFTGLPTPRLITALQDCSCLTVNRLELLSYIEQHFEIYREFAKYSELVAYSELTGMIGLFTMSVEDRFRLYFVSLLFSSGYRFHEGLQKDWAKLPFMLKRSDIEHVIYSSKVSIDRLFAQWYKNDWLRRENDGVYVETSNLYSVFKWALER